MTNKFFKPVKRNGFALILAIAAMAFMVLLVLTLSSVITSKLRLLNAQKDMRLARSNAVLGMSVAVSQLQTSLGVDSAISFPAAIFDADPDTVKIEGVKTPYIVGALPLDINNAGKTFRELQQERAQSLDPLRNGGGQGDPRLNWLISSQKPLKNPVSETMRDLNTEVVLLATYKALEDYPETFGGAVSSTKKNEQIDVFAGKVGIGGTGSYAWWVSDESMKAKINLSRPEKYLDGKTTGSAETFGAPADTRIPQISHLAFIDAFSNLQLNPFLPDFSEDAVKTLSKISSMDEVALLDSTMAQWGKDNKGDYTTYSYGIPVDVTQGKLKQDLSVYFHKNGNNLGIKDSDPIIRGHDNDKDYIGPDYEIKNYDINIPRMGLLRDWATMLEDAGDKFEDGIKARPHVNKQNDTRHGLHPVISKAGWNFRVVYRNEGLDKISLHLAFYPRITIWNPHHVTIEETNYLLRLYMPYYLEMATAMEGYECITAANNGLPSKTSVAPMIQRAKKAVTKKVKGQSDVTFHPYKIYEISQGSGNGIFKPSTGIYNKSSVVMFSHFLKGRGLNKGKGNRSDGEGTVVGPPVINMKIPNLMLKPGETLDLIASDNSNNMQEYDPTGDSKGAPSSRDYPQLMPGLPYTDGGKTIHGLGILIKTGVTLDLKDNPIVRDNIPSADSDNLEFADAVKGEILDPVVVGAWKIHPAQPTSEMVNDSDDNKLSYAYVGYELWHDGNGAYEYLSSLDTTLLNPSGKTNWDTGGNWNGWNKAMKRTTDNFGHGSMFGTMMPRYFAMGYAWRKELDEFSIVSKGTSSYPYDLSSQPSKLISFKYIVDQIPTRLPDKDTNGDGIFDTVSDDPDSEAVMYRRIASYDVIRGKQWFREDSSDGVDAIEFVDRTKSTPYNNVAGGFSTNMHAGSWIAWGIATLGPTKDKDDNAVGYPYMPAYIAHGNHIRDNGNANRVDAMHGYAMMCMHAANQGWGSNASETLMREGRMHWTSAPIGRTKDLGWFSSELDQSYVTKYSSGNDDRYGGVTLFHHTLPNNDHVGAWSKMDGKYRDGFVELLFQYPRSKDDLMSLGVLSNANLSSMVWQPATSFGESWAPPFLKREEIVNDTYKVMHDNELIDISYMLNASMWDRFYMSTIPQGDLKNPFAGMRMPNTRHVLKKLPTNASELYSSKEALEKSAAYVAVDGPFNVNTTSYEAWRAFLSGMLGTTKKSLTEGNYPAKIEPDSPADYLMPNPGNLNTALKPESNDLEFSFRDTGVGRSISEAELDELTREIVAEVKRRAPFFNLADFVNRRLMTASEAQDEDKTYQSLMGTIAAAISRTAENYNTKKPTVFNSDYRFERKNPEARKDLLTFMAEEKPEFTEQSAMAPKGKSFRRFAGLRGAQLLQSQILTGMAPFITVRGDTFTIRAYGEHKNVMTGTTSKAYCEAIVQRSSEPVEASDDIIAPEGAFGRRFNVVSFRWLTPAEL